MQIIGKHIIRLDETDSTNLYAERLLATSGAGEGTVVTAGFQTAGKGQGDNHWESERGKNLLATVIFKPVFLPASEQFLLNKAVTLAVCDLLIRAGIEPAIKWPNDIYAGPGKIAGILISHRVSGSTLEYSIAGIGINLNQERFPQDLRHAVSMKMLTGKEYDVNEMIGEMNILLGRRYGILGRGKPEQLETDYCLRLAGFGKWLRYSAEGNEFEGRIIGVDEFGRLQIALRNGTVNVYSHGEIKHAV